MIVLRYLKAILKRYPAVVSLYGSVWKSPFIIVQRQKYLSPYIVRDRYLVPHGYLNKFPVDASGNPTPWFTYAALYFLKEALQSDWKIFEFGSGYSTLYWNNNCARTVSVEHDETWYHALRSMAPEAEIHLVKQGVAAIPGDGEAVVSAFIARNFDLPSSSDSAYDAYHGIGNVEFSGYATSLVAYPKGYFDVVVVDGRARALCLFVTADYVSEDGIIILDNSDRWQYNALQEYLVHEKGFKRIDFEGLGPVNTFGWTTSIFCKNLSFLERARISRDLGSGDLGW